MECLKQKQSATLGYNNSWQRYQLWNKLYLQQKIQLIILIFLIRKRQNDDEHLLAFSVNVPLLAYLIILFIIILMRIVTIIVPSTGSVGISASQLNNRLNWSVQQAFTNQDHDLLEISMHPTKGQLGDITGGQL